MSDNPVSVFGGNTKMVDTASLAKRAAEAGQNNPRAGGAPDGSDYCNFSGKRGVFEVGTGEKKRTIDKDEIWIVNVASFAEGWVCWKGGRPAATRLSNIYDGPGVQDPDLNELGPFDAQRGEGWFQAKAWVMKSLDDDTQAYLKINSVSGVAEMADLMTAFSQRARVGEPSWPVITLSAESFTSQGYKNYKPKFNIMGWLRDDQLAALNDESVDIEDLIAEAAAGSAGAVEDKSEEAETEAEAEAPKGRRRRRAAK